jgi:GNAT superfamily N-acetyltransferase
MRIQPSAFDTEMLGLRIGKIVVDGLDGPLAEQLRKELMASSLEFAFIRDTNFRFERVSTLPWAHLELADVKFQLTQATRAAAANTLPGFSVVQDVSASDGPALTAMTQAIARLSRFHRCFGEAAAFRLYEAWLRNSLAKRTADWCFVARHTATGDAAGLVAVKREGPTADLTLVATADSYRGRGVLKLMTSTVLTFLQAQGVARCAVATQATNRAALAAYQSLGFTVEGTFVDFHMSRG